MESHRRSHVGLAGPLSCSFPPSSSWPSSVKGTMGTSGAVPHVSHTDVHDVLGQILVGGQAGPQAGHAGRRTVAAAQRGSVTYNEEVEALRRHQGLGQQQLLRDRNSLDLALLSPQSPQTRQVTMPPPLTVDPALPGRPSQIQVTVPHCRTAPHIPYPRVSGIRQVCVPLQNRRCSRPEQRKREAEHQKASAASSLPQQLPT